MRCVLFARKKCRNFLTGNGERDSAGANLSKRNGLRRAGATRRGLVMPGNRGNGRARVGAAGGSGGGLPVFADEAEQFPGTADADITGYAGLTY